MNTLIFSDVHVNLPALAYVINKHKTVDSIVTLGNRKRDIIGRSHRLFVNFIDGYRLVDVGCIHRYLDLSKELTLENKINFL